MRLLAIDTTTEKIIIGLYNEGERRFFVGEKGSKRHNSALLTHIDNILSENGLCINDVDVFGVVSGPGSFTGIRIGVATINALAFAMKKPIVEITSLEQNDDGSKKMVLLDCRHNNYYAGIFGEQTQYLALNSEEVNKYDIKKEYLIDSDEGKILDKCIKKANELVFVDRARPFYLKKSSAER